MLVELPEAEDLVENRTDTQFLSLEGDRNPAVSIWDERCGWAEAQALGAQWKEHVAEP